MLLQSLVVFCCVELTAALSVVAAPYRPVANMLAEEVHEAHCDTVKCVGTASSFASQRANLCHSKMTACELVATCLHLQGSPWWSTPSATSTPTCASGATLPVRCVETASASATAHCRPSATLPRRSASPSGEWDRKQHKVQLAL